MSDFTLPTSPSPRALLALFRRLLPAAALAAALLPAMPADAAKGDCGQPQSTGTKPSAGDCLYVLKSAVKVVSCELCVCDVNNSGTLTATDGLQCLRKAVGLTVTLTCPSCSPVTTTTLASTGSTTSTSTTSTTTTLPVNCTTNGDCSALPDGFRCNPNTDTCEKPCTRDNDCKDFYLCNKTTGYCEEPAPLF